MTFGQLLIQLEQLRKDDPKLLEAPLKVQTEGNLYEIELTVTLLAVSSGLRRCSMGNRVLAAKRLKAQRQRQAAPRTLGVNWANNAAVTAGSVDLVLEGVTWYEEQTKKPRAPSLEQLGVSFNGLKSITVIPRNVFQKMQIFFTPKKDAFYIVWYRYDLKIVRISGSYPSLGRAKTAFERDPKKVLWKYKKELA